MDRVVTVVAMVVVVTFRFGIGTDGLVTVVAMVVFEVLVVDMVTITWLSLLSFGLFVFYDKILTTVLI